MIETLSNGTEVPLLFKNGIAYVNNESNPPTAIYGWMMGPQD